MDLYGRDVEFAELRGLWQAVADGQGPRAIAYIADTGVGKSRLVQELYHHLSRAADPFDYWPDAFLDAGASLQVTPPFPAGHRPAGPPMFLTPQNDGIVYGRLADAIERRRFKLCQ